MLSIQIRGDRELIERFEAMPSKARTALKGKITILAHALHDKVVNDKLSGQVLNRITGNLARSINEEVEDNGSSILGKVFSDASVKYAAIHEMGGVIHVPDIVPVKAQALHWIAGGKDVFAMHARAHDVTMPERSYLRSSLADMKDQILGGMRESVIDALRAK